MVVLKLHIFCAQNLTPARRASNTTKDPPPTSTSTPPVKPDLDPPEGVLKTHSAFKEGSSKISAADIVQREIRLMEVSHKARDEPPRSQSKLASAYAEHTTHYNQTIKEDNFQENVSSEGETPTIHPGYPLKISKISAYIYTGIILSYSSCPLHLGPQSFTLNFPTISFTGSCSDVLSFSQCPGAS